MFLNVACVARDLYVDLAHGYVAIVVLNSGFRIRDSADCFSCKSQAAERKLKEFLALMPADQLEAATTQLNVQF